MNDRNGDRDAAPTRHDEYTLAAAALWGQVSRSIRALDQDRKSYRVVLVTTTTGVVRSRVALEPACEAVARADEKAILQIICPCIANFILLGHRCAQIAVFLVATSACLGSLIARRVTGEDCKCEWVGWIERETTWSVSIAMLA